MSMIEETQYVLKQKLVSLGINFTITDVEGSDAFQVKGEAASIGDKLSLQDPDGNELVYIEQQSFNCYQLSRDGRHLADISRDLMSFRRRRFTIGMSGPDDLEAIGDILSFEYVVKRGDRKIATFTRQWFRLSDTYFIQIHDPQADQALVLAIAVVIEVVVHGRHNY